MIYYLIVLGERGYYDKVLRHKFIIINSSLPEHIQRQVYAHELGHALLQKVKDTILYDRPYLLSSSDRSEREKMSLLELLLYFFTAISNTTAC